MSAEAAPGTKRESAKKSDGAASPDHDTATSEPDQVGETT